jgi:chromosome segregation protein
MRLQGVTLFGFKSFADRTDVRILPGITAIVGPNGCGKSNISDALRWALGEQSPKALRGHRMEDVIFHGSASRRPLGLAEVMLTFSNDGELSVPWSEVGVGRRLYRDGESEYVLNKSVCRLKDVHDLFLGTGVNPKAYALMEQERRRTSSRPSRSTGASSWRRPPASRGTSSSEPRRSRSSRPPGRTSCGSGT